MKFTLIDRSTWDREEYFHYFLDVVPCRYNMTDEIDITPIMKRHARPYPALLHFIGTVENHHKRYRMAFNEKGELGYYDVVHPTYTVFHRDDHTFSAFWTPYSEKYEDFLHDFEEDEKTYGDRKGLFGKPDFPKNVFPASVVPWMQFKALHLSFPKAFHSLIPMYTLGRIHRKRSHYYIPLAVEFHHAVCDGYHGSRVFHELQGLINRWK